MTSAGDRDALRLRRAAAGKLADLRRTEEDALAAALAQARREADAARDERRRLEERQDRLRRERRQRRTRRLDEASGARAARVALADDEDRAAREILRRGDQDVGHACAADAEAVRRVERLAAALENAVAARRAAEAAESRDATALRRLDEAAAEAEQEDVAAARHHATKRNPPRS